VEYLLQGQKGAQVALGTVLSGNKLLHDNTEELEEFTISCSYLIDRVRCYVEEIS
jgi:hypothetical protein